VKGLVSGIEINAHLIENSNRLLSEFLGGGGVGINRFFVSEFYVPSYPELAEYVSSGEAAKIFPASKISSIMSSSLISQLREKNADRTHSFRGFSETDTVFTPHDVFNLMGGAKRAAFDYDLQVLVRNLEPCENGNLAVFRIYTEFNMRSMPDSELSMFDLGWWWSNFALSSKALNAVSVIELANVFGLEISEFGRKGVNITLTPHELERAYGFIGSSVHPDERLAWISLAAWEAGNVSKFYTMLPVVVGLSDTTTFDNVLSYLRAGLSSVDEVRKYVQADIELATAQPYFDAGVFKFSTVRKAISTGVDASLMRDLIAG